MRRILTFIASLLAVLLIPGSAPVFAQTSTSQAATSSETTWLRDFASPSTGNNKGRENQLNWDARFNALLESSLHQGQYFWHDHGRFTPVPELVHLFIGVPGDVLLADDRYVTITGCVPHDCADRGLVWVDTAPASKTPLIFVATGGVSNGPTDRNSLIHLRIFSSVQVNWRQLPPQFLESFNAWWNATTQIWDKYSPEKVVVITIVQPSGETVDVSPSILLRSAESVPKNQP